MDLRGAVVTEPRGSELGGPGGFATGAGAEGREITGGTWDGGELFGILGHSGAFLFELLSLCTALVGGVEATKEELVGRGDWNMRR